ncbi:MAG: hypothetical protein ACTSQ4_10490 [Candidatus Heimdallarchaeaceae archaeon]
MSEHSKYMKQARKEVDSCLNIWKEIFEENYSKSLEFAYAKGSATKNWDTYIDYVPVLSDVDIHLKVNKHSSFLSDDNSFYESVNISEMYETRFLEQNPNNFHLPRTQVIKIDDIVDKVNFIHPRESGITPIFGKPVLDTNPSNEVIKQIDLKNVLELEEFLPTLPMSMIDRTGLDLWSLVRRLNWRVSPSPIRILSQLYDDPLDVWEMNRTSITELLEKHDLHLISESYKDYYYEGWISFMEGFSNSQSLRRIISNGFDILKLCIEEAKKISESKNP